MTTSSRSHRRSAPTSSREIDIVEEVGAPGRVQRDPAHAAAHDRRRAVGSPSRQRERRLVADVLVGVGRCRGDDGPAHRRRRPRTVRAADRRHRRGHERAAGRGADPAARDPARTAQGGGPQRGPGSRGPRAVRARPRVPRARRRAQLLPDERDHLAVAAHRDRAPQPDRARPTGRRVRRGRCARRARRGAGARPTSELVAGPAPGFDPAPGAAITVDGAPIGHVGALAARCSSAFGIPVGRGRVRARPRRPARRRRGATARSGRSSRFPASNIDLAFVLADTVPAADVERTLRAAAASCSRRCACFDEFRSRRARRRGAAASRSRCGSGRPTAR